MFWRGKQLLPRLPPGKLAEQWAELYDCYALPTGVELASEPLGHQPPGCEGFVALDVRSSDHPTCKILLPPGGSKGVAFAVLDKLTSVKLKAIDFFDTVRFEALVEVEQLRLRKSIGTKATPKILEITVNIYGSWSVAEHITRRLHAMSTFLQDPKILMDGGRYTNPHLLVSPDDELDMRRHVGGVKRSISGWRDKEIDPLSLLFEPPKNHQLGGQDSRSEDVG